MTSGAGTVPKASGQGTDLSGHDKTRMISTEGGGRYPRAVQRLRLIAVLIISVNTTNHGANVANNKGDIS